MTNKDLASYTDYPINSASAKELQIDSNSPDSPSKYRNTGDIADIAADLGEVGLDKLLSDGFLKDIPVLGTLVKLAKAGKGVQDYIFAKKVNELILNIKNISETEIDKFIQKMEKDNKLQNRVVDHITLLLTRLDDLEKPQLVAKAFVGYMKNKLNFNEYKRISRAIDRCMTRDLEMLSKFEKPTGDYEEISHELLSCGLIKIHQVPGIASPDAKIIYIITDMGKLFIRLIF